MNHKRTKKGPKSGQKLIKKTKTLFLFLRDLGSAGRRGAPRGAAGRRGAPRESRTPSGSPRTH